MIGLRARMRRPAGRRPAARSAAAVVLVMALGAAVAAYPALLAGSAGGTGGARGARGARGAGSAGGAGSGARRAQRSLLLGATDPRARLDFSLVLRLPGRSRMRRFLSALYDPGAAQYHHFIDAREFGERFGVSSRVLRAASAQLARDDVRITASYPQRTALDVSAPAAAVERLFGVRMLDYLGPGGRRFHTPAGRLTVPRDLRAAITAVAGLDGTVQLSADDVPAEGVTPSVASVAYDTAPLNRLQIRGQHEKIAIISLATYSQADLSKFADHFGLPPLTPVNIPVAGGSADEQPGDQSEAELDLEVAHEIAPDAQLLDYNAPQATSSGADSLAEVIDRIVADGQAEIVSDSWGSCEISTASADIQLDEQAIEAAVAHGISIFKSAGDAGAYECQEFDHADHRLSVEWPASSPGVIAVGGTSLSVSAGGAYVGETSWEDPLEQAGGGGGLSAYFARPAWQSAPGVESRFSDGKRQLPDVSADADVATGWATYTAGSAGETGGTSAAAPFWAASMALIEQYARRSGVAHLGFVDPVLYAIASSSQPYRPFHDVTVGTDRYYPATAGWDFATGLGSPDVYNLAQDIVRYLKGQS
ncbi:MAG: S8 family serine peptidase [Solirubrobacteraceae bacterium]